MAGATLTTLSNVLKEYYLPPLRDQLNEKVLGLQRIQTSSKEIVGKSAFGPVRYGRNTGVGARGENVALAAAGNQVADRWTFDITGLYGRLRVSGFSMVKTAQDAGSFVQVLRYEMDFLRQDLQKDLARQFYGNGDGVLGTISSGVASATQTLTSAEPLRKGQIFPGQLIDIGTAASPQARLDGTSGANPIVSVSVSAVQFVLTSSVTTTTSDIVTRQGSNFASGTYEINGLQNAIPTATNTFGGINAAAAGKDYWDVQRVNMNGALTQDAMVQVWNSCVFKGETPSAMYTTLGVQRAYFNLLQSQVRYTEPTSLSGGFKALDFNGSPLIADVDAPFGKLFFLDEASIILFSNSDWHFLDEDGDMLKWVVGFDAWEAVLARYMQLGASRRNSQGLLYGITDASGV